MKKPSSLIARTKKVAGEVSDAAVGAVKAVVRAAKSKLSAAKPPKARKRSVTAKRPKVSQSGAAKRSAVRSKA